MTIERVDIVGNDRTREKVIRRGLSISEGDLYNADSFENTKGNLEAMDFFEAVRLKTGPGSKSDKMVVTVEVIEKKTGSLSAGLGYSSQDGAMGNINLKERNLFGLGIVANARSNLSGRRNDFEGSLSYPWMFDYPLTGSIRGHKAQQKESYYMRDTDGFSVHLGYPIYGLWSMSTGFSRDSNKLTGFEQVFARSVVDYYKQYGTQAQKYMNISENAVSLNFSRDTRNSSVIPTGGSKISLGGRFSGLGGDVAFNSYYSEAMYYYPLYWRLVMKFRANASMLQESGLNPIPFDRRIVLGGIQSIRGYRQGDIGPKDRHGNIIGGDRAVFGNVECLFPLLDQLKLNGVAFFDAGNSWNVSESPLMTQFKAGAGLGIRWISPMGPIRIEYGWKINPQKGEEPGAVAFADGAIVLIINGRPKGLSTCDGTDPEGCMLHDKISQVLRQYQYDSVCFSEGVQIMKKVFVVLILSIAALFVVASVHDCLAQSAKFAFVDFQKFAGKSKRAQHQQQKFAQMVDAKRVALENKKKEMDTLNEQLQKQGPMLKEETRNEKIKQLGIKEMELKLAEKEAQKRSSERAERAAGDL